MRLRCPHCGDWSVARSSDTLSATVTRHYLACRNTDCGHTWRATSEADLTLSLSATPSPRVMLPLSSHLRRELLIYLLQTSHSVEHRPVMGYPTTGDLFETLVPDGPS